MTHIHDSVVPAPFLVENINLLPKGRVLDVATGTGRNAIYLAKMGFHPVEGVDISAEAISTALNSARKAGVSIIAQTADLASEYQIRKSAYDVIIGGEEWRFFGARHIYPEPMRNGI